MKRNKFPELEKLNRMLLPHLNKVMETVWKGEHAQDKAFVYTISLAEQIRKLLEEDEEVKTKYKDQKLF